MFNHDILWFGIFIAIVALCFMQLVVVVNSIEKKCEKMDNIEGIVNRAVNHAVEEGINRAIEQLRQVSFYH